MILPRYPLWEDKPKQFTIWSSFIVGFIAAVLLLLLRTPFLRPYSTVFRLCSCKHDIMGYGHVYPFVTRVTVTSKIIMYCNQSSGDNLVMMQ